jgi:hypothetical protein
MKTLLLLSMMLPFLSCSSVFVKSSGRNPKPDGPATSYEYQLSGTMRYPYTYYVVNRDSTGMVRIAWLTGHEPDVRVIRGPEDFFLHLDEMVAQYNLHKLKNRYLPRADVRDGKMWHAYIRFANNGISTGGDNAWPPQALRDGIDAINQYIQSLIEASSEEDVLEVYEYD